MHSAEEPHETDQLHNRSSYVNKKCRCVVCRADSNDYAKACRARSKTARIRQWARDNGHKVADVGRLSLAVTAAYEKAHRPSTDAKGET